MEGLSETYLKAKRYLVFFSGTQLLICLIGLSPATESDVLGVTIGQPEYLSTATFFVVLYYLFQITLFWDAQIEPVKKKPQHVDDYRASLAIALLSSLAVPITMNLHYCGIAWFENEAQTNQPPHIAHVLLLYVTLPIAWLGYFYYARTSVSRRKEKFLSQQNDVLGAITGNKWRLIFNPIAYKQTQGRRGSKSITFLTNGDVGEGRNINEHKWRLNGAFLELINSDGALFSRFAYDKADNSFAHTNDEDTISIRGQILEPLEAISPS